MLSCLQLQIISALIFKSSARIAFPHDYDGNDVDSYNDDAVNNDPANFVITGEPLWILTLSEDGWLGPKLRLGDSEEAEDFFNNIEPGLRKSKSRAPVRVKKNDPEQSSITNSQPQKSNKELQKDLLQLINKFVLSINSEPDAYKTNSAYDSDEPSIEFYLKGPYTVMIVKLGRKEWHYPIYVNSMFPQWFFESHDTWENPLPIPEDVKTKLYNSIPRLFKLLFSYPH